jgi:FkbM family methyltransferase
MRTVFLAHNGHNLTIHLRDEADESVLAEIFRLREYRRAEETIQMAKGTIIDVGAHSGLFTLYAKSLNASVPVIAIEPEKGNIALFKKHMAENNTAGVTLVEGALGGAYAKQHLFVTDDSHNHHLLDVGDENTATEVVQVYTLTHLIEKSSTEKIALIKMDIEGGEYDVLAGATDEDYAHVQAIIMEYHDSKERNHKELEQTLREHGFGVQTFPSHFDRTMGFLWATNKRTM